MDYGQISDPQVELLATIADSLKSDYPDDSEQWLGSPFGWIRDRPSRQKGAICEKLVSGYFEALGYRVRMSGDSQADRVIEGLRVEIKSSFLWKNGAYRFQQFRDQDYRAVVCMGISPSTVHAWAIPKDVVMATWGKAGGLVSQHGGRHGTETAWLTINPFTPQTWLERYGGSLADARLSFDRHCLQRRSNRHPL